jgi:hypothetical protein
MVVMWSKKRTAQNLGPNPADGSELPDLGSQLEDLWTHVMRCERWARFDDRLDLALKVVRTPGRRVATDRR